MISKREATYLVQKLDAASIPCKRHLKVRVFVDGVREAHFNISHDVRKPNWHIASELGLSMTDTRALARCQLSRDWYEKRVRARRASETPH